MDVDDEFEQFRKVGQKYIRDNWRYFHSKTRGYFEANGYDKVGRRLEGEFFSDIEMLEYSLGLFKESAACNRPTEKNDQYPSFLVDNELIVQASNLLSHDNIYYSQDFARIAIHAIMKRQAALAFSKLVSEGVKFGSPSYLKIAASLIFVIFSWLMLPVSLANAITEAFKGDSTGASVWFFLALFTANTLYNKKEEKTVDLIAYERWGALFYEDYPFFHIGNSYGLKAKLENMISQGIYVPSLLIDLCVLLQSYNEELE